MAPVTATMADRVTATMAVPMHPVTLTAGTPQRTATAPIMVPAIMVAGTLCVPHTGMVIPAGNGEDHRCCVETSQRLAATLAARGVLQVVASDERVAIAARASAEPARLAALRVWAG